MSLLYKYIYYYILNNNINLLWMIIIYIILYNIILYYIILYYIILYYIIFILILNNNFISQNKLIYWKKI